MIDARLLAWQSRLLGPLARGLVNLGVRAEQISIAGFVLGVLTVPALAFDARGLALCLLALNRLGDGLDGEVARLTGPTDRGAFLDVALDFMFYALYPLGFALANPLENALSAAVLIAAFVGTGSSFLAFATIAAKRGLRVADYPTKGIAYLGGLTEGFETITIFVLMTLFPVVFPFLAYLFAAACLFTTLTRWHQGWTDFADRPPDPSPDPQP